MICSKCWKLQKKDDKWYYIKFIKSGKIYGLCEKCYNSKDIQEILKKEPDKVKDTTILEYMLERDIIEL